MTEQALQGELIQRPASESPGVTVNGQPIDKTAGNGGAYEGADRLGRELGTWSPRIASADGSLGRNDKLLLDARGKDILRNSGQMQGASNLQKDSIVGAQYRLNSQPNIIVLGKGFDEKWAEEFQMEVEAKFNVWAESPDCWVDAARVNTFTGLIRLAIGCFFAGGEVLGTAEWMRGALRPFSTAIQMIDADRLSNPHDGQDTKFLRRGIERDRYGAPVAAHIRMAHPRDIYGMQDSFAWKRVAIRKPWGRLQVLHIIEQSRPDQTRGIADMVAVLKESRMAKKFHEVSLQNAIVQASYAAAIESELPSDMAFDSIGAGTAADGRTAASLSLLQAIAQYSRGGRNLEIDGVKIPHLFPGSKLKLLPAGTVGGVGQNFEESLNRYIAAGLGISYEEYTHDFSKANYSSMRAAGNNTLRFMQSRKRVVADRTANAIYTLWMEEAISEGVIESLPQRAKDPNFFYEGMNKDALCAASWVGASRGQVDELKETQAAVLRINAGLSTWEAEIARMGYDFREVFRQQARERAMQAEHGLTFQTGASKPGTMSGQRGEDDNAGANDDNKEAAAFDDGFGD